jgi:hypothetical protein
MAARVCIGIDPDRGLAVWDRREKRLVQVKTTTFWGIAGVLACAGAWDGGAEVHIEAPHLNRPVWIRAERGASRIAQNVGENKAKAKLLIEYCDILGLMCFESRPTRRSMTKLSAEQFGQITGWKGQTSEHGRDAGMLVFGL